MKQDHFTLAICGYATREYSLLVKHEVEWIKFDIHAQLRSFPMRNFLHIVMKAVFLKFLFSLRFFSVQGLDFFP